MALSFISFFSCYFDYNYNYIVEVALKWFCRPQGFIPRLVSHNWGIVRQRQKHLSRKHDPSFSWISPLTKRWVLWSIMGFYALNGSLHFTNTILATIYISSCVYSNHATELSDLRLLFLQVHSLGVLLSSYTSSTTDLSKIHIIAHLLKLGVGIFWLGSVQNQNITKTNRFLRIQIE